MAGYGIKSFLIAQSLNQIEKAYGAEQFDPRQLPCARGLRHQRRAHRQARLGCAGHRDRDCGDATQLCRSPAVALARPSDGVAAGDGAAAADARRGDAAAARRRIVAGLGPPADPRQEGALLRGSPAVRSASCRRRSSASSRKTATRRRTIGARCRFPRPPRDRGTRRSDRPSTTIPPMPASGASRNLPEHEEIVPERTPSRPRVRLRWRTSR